MNRGGACRAFDALSLEEEKHALLAHAHLALAAKCRERAERGLQGSPAKQGQVLKGTDRARADYDRLWKELGRNLAAASEEAKMDEDLLAAAMFVPDFRSDMGLLAHVASQVPCAMEYVDLRLIQDRATMLKLVTVDGGMLEHAGTSFRGDKELVLAAVASNAWALEHASDELQADREVVLAALKTQSRADVACTGCNVLEAAGEDLNADLELVLEAVRVDGRAVRLAALQLIEQEDFVLRAMRKAPYEERHYCFCEADETACPPTGTLEEFLGACDSALALKGENAPILTVTLSTAQGDADGSAAPTLDGYQVSLLSGTTFSCSLQQPEPAALPESTGRQDASDTKNTTNETMIEEHEEEGPAQKHARLTGSSTQPGVGSHAGAGASAEIAGARKEAGNTSQKPPSSMTVAQLAKLLLAELPKHVQVERAPEHIFLVFAKPSSDGSGEDSTPVRVWDWNRPISDFS